MAKIFVSYSRKDSATARKIIQALKDIGQDVWVDWEDIPPASDWMDQIKRGIEGSDAFIFLVSPFSAKSGYCTDEINHAEKNKKRIIPVVINPVKPEDTIDIIRKLNWIFIRKEDDFKEGIEKIKTAIEVDFEWVAKHSELQSRALKWHREKDSSLLLRGRDLWTARQMIANAEKKDPPPTDLQKLYVQDSNRNQRRVITLSVLAVGAIIALAILANTAFAQSKLATQNANDANIQREKAEVSAKEAIANAHKADANAKEASDNAKRADENAKQATEAKTLAEENAKIASAQRSAARAQIYQIRSGELYTSTLLAIDSWQTTQSVEAEEILRENISLLPIPVNRMAHAGSINALQFDDTGEKFVSAGADGSVCVWQVSDGRNLFCIDSQESVNDAVFIPRKNLILAGNDAGSLQFINVESKADEEFLQFDSSILDVEVSKDSRYAAITRENGKIAIIDLTTRKKVGNDLDGRNTKLTAFHPKQFKFASGSSDGVISIWDLTSNTPPLATKKHTSDISAIVFSPDGSILITGSSDGAVVATETISGNEMYRVRHGGRVNDIAFAPSGAWFVTVSNDRTIKVWDIASCTLLSSMSQGNIVRSVQVSSNNQWIASTGDDKTVRVWSAITGTELYQIPIQGKGSVLGFSKDGRHLVGGDLNGNLYIWDISAINSPVGSFQFKNAVTSALYNPAGKQVAVTTDKRIWLLNSESIRKITVVQDAPFRSLLANSRKIAFSANGDRLGILTAQNEIVLYNLQTGSGKTIPPNGVALDFIFSPDGRQLMIGDSLGTLQSWDAVSGKFIKSAASFKKRITALANTTDYIAVGLENEVDILDANTYAIVNTIKTEGDSVTLVFSHDGTRLGLVTSNDQVLIWDQQGGTLTPLTTIPKENIASLAFSPDNRLLAIGTVDTALLYDLSLSEEVFRIQLTGTVNNISFSADSTTLMTSTLKFLQFWDLTTLKARQTTRQDIVETACRHLFENFSLNQWSRLFESNPYQALCPNLPTP